MIHLAVIGCGGQGRRNLERMFEAAKGADVPAVRALAVCDADSARAADLKRPRRTDGTAAGPTAARSPPPRPCWTPSGSELDAVIVATPDHQHAPAAVAAADAGLAVYCEKPLANSVSGLRRDPRRRGGRNGVPFQVGSHERSNAKVRRACELVRGGALGELKEVVLQMPTEQAHHRAVAATTAAAPLVPPPSSLDYAMWLGDKTPADSSARDPRRVAGHAVGGPGRCRTGCRSPGRTSGGGSSARSGPARVTDRGAHILDIAQLATGRDDADDWRPTAVTGAGGDRPGAFYDAPMRYDFRVTFASGPEYVGTTEGDRGLRFVGEKGELFVAVHGGKTTAEPASLLDAATDVDLGRTASHHANFLRSLSRRGELFAPARAGHRTAVLCHQINAALKAG